MRYYQNMRRYGLEKYPRLVWKHELWSLVVKMFHVQSPLSWEEERFLLRSALWGEDERP